MSFKLLPKSTEEFSDTKFWEGFFKTRGSKAFEWYGEYQDMVALWAQYVKSGDRVLNIGCGNSDLGAELHDRQGCEVLCVDTSSTVVQQMTRKHCAGGSRPRLAYRVMDAARMEGLEDGGFACAVDKGTLDALMSSADSAVDAMLAEVHRILRVGGRHLIVSLCQRQVVDKLLEHVTSRSWIVRVHQATAVSAADPSGFPLPVFFCALTKLRPGPATATVLLQVQDAYSTGPPERLDSVQSLADWIRRAQLTAYSLARPDGGGGGGDGRQRETQFAYACGRTGLTAFACHLLTHASPSRRRSGYAVFIEPLGDGGDASSRGTTTPEQRRDLLESQASLRRLLLVRLHPWLHYESDAAIQAALSRLVMAFAPRPGMPESEVPFLSAGSLAYPYRTVAREGRYVVEGSECGALRLQCPDSDLVPLQCRLYASTADKASSSAFARFLDAFVQADGADAADPTPVAFINWPCDLDHLATIRKRRLELRQPAPSFHVASATATADPRLLDILADRFGFVFERRLPTPDSNVDDRLLRPHRLLVLFPRADSIAAYVDSLSPEALARVADACGAGGRLVMATRLFDKKSAVADANAVAVAALRRDERFAGVCCATLDDGDDDDDDLTERRRYWVACASASAESAVRACDLLSGLPGVTLVDEGPTAESE